MKKLSLFTLLLALMIAGVSLQSFAQYNATLGARFIVNTPTALEGTKTFTYSSDPATGSSAWGGALGSYYRVPLIKGLDGTDTFATNLLTNNVTGKWVLVWRGNNVYFSDKAYNCFLAGAAGVIIVNNQPGMGPIDMAASTANNHASLITIPVLMLGYNDGMALNTALNLGQADTISITPWGFGLAHDLAIVPGSTCNFPYGAIPLSQVKGANANTPKYSMYNSGFVANVGTSTETNIVFNNSVYWTPTGGSQTLLRNDTLKFPSIATTDSILTNTNDTIYSTPATTTGRYDQVSYVSYTNTDGNPFDDTVKAFSYVTDSIFCMGRWDAANNQPYQTNSSRGWTANPTTFGPLFYMQDGPYRAVKVQMAIFDGDTANHDLNTLAGDQSLFVTMFKWVDGSNGQTQDGLIQPGELTQVGVGSKTFVSSDSTFKFFTVQMNDAAGDTGSSAYTRPSSYYFFSVDMPATWGLVTDPTINYGRRLVISQAVDTFASWFGAENPSNQADLLASASANMDMIPFINSTTITSSTVNTEDPSQLNIRDFDGIAPAFAFYTSKNQDHTGVNNVVKENMNFTIYPNPAVGTNVHVKLNLSSVAPKVEFHVMNALGKTVKSITMNNLQNEDVVMPTANLVPGLYYIYIFANGALMTKPFTVLAR